MFDFTRPKTPLTQPDNFRSAFVNLLASASNINPAVASIQHCFDDNRWTPYVSHRKYICPQSFSTLTDEIFQMEVWLAAKHPEDPEIYPFGTANRYMEELPVEVNWIDASRLGTATGQWTLDGTIILNKFFEDVSPPHGSQFDRGLDSVEIKWNQLTLPIYFWFEGEI